jgi:septal ring factor EnvC (AmiA/AmiB activator)
MHKRCRIAPLLLALLAYPALATVQDDLDKTQKDLEASRSHQAELEARSHKLEEELASIQEKLVKLADYVQKTEGDLSAAEEKLGILNEQLTTKSEALKARQKDLNGLIQAALRLSRTPPEAMVMMPGDMTRTIKAARALKMASDSIKQETEIIGMQMAELEQLKQKVARNRDDIASKQEVLAKERRTMTEKLAERKELQTKLGYRQKEIVDRINRLAKRAEDLKGLVSSIEEETQQNQQADGLRADEQAPTRSRGHLRSFASAQGAIHAPVNGKIVGEYGVADGRDGKSKGILIEARDRAQVVAPYDGEVVFTGPFLNYGRLVILRHSDHFHTLLAGLSKIDTSVGQFLLEGEPIGAMGDNESGNRLYVELRKNNQPVDPAPWISGLNK